jgi:nicotinamidase-related amidase
MAENTAVVLVDPYNDFLHPNGKLNKGVAESLAATGTIEHLKEIVAAARQHKIPIFYALHQQTDAHSFQSWRMMNWSLGAIHKSGAFAKGSWGVEIYEGLGPEVDNGDVVVSQHWNSKYINSFPEACALLTASEFAARSRTPTWTISCGKGASRM